MKARRLIEALKQVSPDTEVMCGVTVKDTPTLFTINLFDLERTQKYEVKSVLTKPNNDKYCTLLIKRNQKGVKNMVTPIEDQLRGQLRELKDSHNQLWYQLVEEQKENENLEARLKLLSDFTEDFTQQINRSIMVENHVIDRRLHAINKLLNDLYEEINGNYIETLGRDDELAIVRAKTELDLITKILDEVEKI